MERDSLVLNTFFSFSFFYAADRFEVRLISMFKQFKRFFVFCGSKLTEEMFLQQMDTAPDYNVIGYRKVELDEIISTEWFPSFMEGFNDPVFIKEQLHHDIKQPFAYYVVYDLKKQLPKDYGHNRFKLFYICGETVSTYQALYYSNKCHPYVIARMYNRYNSRYESLTYEGELLHNVIINNPYGIPNNVLIGGGDNARNNHDIPVWEEYILDSEFMKYNEINLEDNIVVWRRKLSLIDQLNI